MLNAVAGTYRGQRAGGGRAGVCRSRSGLPQLRVARSEDLGWRHSAKLRRGAPTHPGGAPSICRPIASLGPWHGVRYLRGMDELRNRGSRDGERINLDDEQDVSFWTSELEVSKQSLEAAVNEVGVIAKDVRAHLARKVTRF